MTEDEWNPIETAPHGINVLITDGIIVTGGRQDKYGWDVVGVTGYEWEIQFEPTHWMPMPALPKV